MADIQTTINAMAKKDTSPTAPEPVEVSKPTLTAIQIQTIAKELAQPWKYGTALHRFAKLHNVPLKLVREIAQALEKKQQADTPAPEPVEVEKP